MGVAAFGAVLTVGTAVAEVTSISGPNITTDMIDVSSHDSADQAREFVAGMIDGGELTIDGNLTTTNAADLLDLQAAGTKTTGATLAVGGILMTFDCYVSTTNIDSPYDGKASFSATLKVTGLPVLTVPVV